jgi:hypothetical protein
MSRISRMSVRSSSPSWLSMRICAHGTVLRPYATRPAHARATVTVRLIGCESLKAGLSPERWLQNVRLRLKSVGAGPGKDTGPVRVWHPEPAPTSPHWGSRPNGLSARHVPAGAPPGGVTVTRPVTPGAVIRDVWQTRHGSPRASVHADRLAARHVPVGSAGTRDCQRPVTPGAATGTVRFRRRGLPDEPAAHRD